MSQPPLKPKDRWVKIISNDGHIRAIGIYAQNLVEYAAKTHSLRGFPAVALGEAMIGSLLLASYCKGEQRVNLNIQTTGQVRQVFVDAYPDGKVRGYILTRDEKEVVQNPKFGPWGEGLLSILRSHEKIQAQPYVGSVPLVTGHLAKDLSYYWLQSEQVPSAVGVCVTQSMDGNTGPAGGFLVQAMPGASPQALKTIEDHIQTMPSLAAKLVADSNPLQILSEIFQSTPFLVLEEKEIGFYCQCSLERVKNALKLIGVTELKALLKEEGKASVTCDFCNKDYIISEDEIKEMIATG